MSEKHTYKTNIKCSGCVATVTPFLNKLTNAQWQVDLNSNDRILTVEADKVDDQAVEQLLKEAGYAAEKISE